MEYWDIYDIHRNKLNKTHKRGTTMISSHFHLVVHLCIINSNGQVLIQQRQPFKDGWPNMWDLTAAGSALVNETSQSAIHRELLEELGLDINFDDIRPFFTLNFTEGFDDFYVIYKDVDLSKLILQDQEVQNAKWVYPHEIFTMIQNNQFIPYHPSLIQLLLDFDNNYSAHKKR